MDGLSGNPMFTAGAGLVGVGTVLALARQGLRQLDYFARRRLLTTLEIPSYDKSHLWVLQWITQQAARNTQHLSIRTAFHQHDNGSISTQFRFVPGPGKHYFRWRGVWFQVCVV
jgi:chaperone BCS1